MEFLNIFKEWHVLIQGALGSALFWLSLKIIQAIYKESSQQYLSFSKKSKLSWLYSCKIKYTGFLGPQDEVGVYCITSLIYRCLRLFLLAMVWLVFGFILTVFYPALSIIGYLGCLHYLIEALEVVSPISSTKEEIKEALDRIDNEIKRLENT